MLQRNPDYQPAFKWRDEPVQLAILVMLASIGAFCLVAGHQASNPLVAMLGVSVGLALSVGSIGSFILDRISPLFHTLSSTDEELEQEIREARRRDHKTPKRPR